MTSNGYLFDEKLVTKAVHSWNLEDIQITLDGTENVYNKTKNYIYKNTNAFKRVIDNIGLLLKAGVRVMIRLNIGEHNKEDLYELVKYPETMANISFVEQTELSGTAKAIYMAKQFVGNEPFAILFGDDVMYNDGKPVIKQLIDVFENTGKSVIGCKNVPLKDVTKYASVEFDKVNGNEYEVNRIIEKPPIHLIKSTLSPLGRYVVVPEIFSIIENLKPGANNEYQLTDALSIIAEKFGMIALEFEGQRYDMGNRLGMIKANVEYGLRDEETREELINYLKSLNLN
jgi:UTP--glucose-1-phosphate uridylyltransferase